VRGLTSLNQPKDFSALINQRPVITVGPFALHLKPRQFPQTDEPAQIGPRLGMVLPKRLIRLSVARNQIKRWLRPLVRESLGRHSVDVLLRVKAPLNLKSPESREIHKKELALTFQKAAERLGHLS
jgi:ribonuclease P protein component